MSRHRLGLIKYGLVFIFSLVVWSWLQLFYLNPGVLSYYWLYIMIGYPFVLVLSLGCLLVPRLRVIPCILWAAPVALGLVRMGAKAASPFLTDQYRYYIGMDIQTPNGLKMCKSMIEYTNPNHHKLPYYFRINHDPLKGDAVFCDLGDGRNVVALLSLEGRLSGRLGLKQLPWLAAGYPIERGEKWLPFYIGRIELKDNLIPKLVTYDDINDPMSVKQVIPGKMDDVLGVGYKLKSVWVEMTHDPYTKSDLRENLPWLGKPVKDRKQHYSAAFKAIGLHGMIQPLERRY